MSGTPLPENSYGHLETFRLPSDRSAHIPGGKPPPRHQAGDPFIKGPIPFEWMSVACRLLGSGLHVAMLSQFLCCRYPSPNRWGLDAIAQELNLSRNSTRRGLHQAEQAGLLIVDREPGCKLAISISSPSGFASKPFQRPLYGPIPWDWWQIASHRPGKTLQVAAVCWLLAGWERSARVELGLNDWEEFGLSRFSISAGLAALEKSALVTTSGSRGRSPFATLLQVVT